MASSNAAIGAATDAWLPLAAGGQWMFPIFALALLSWAGTVGALAAVLSRRTGRTAVALSSLAGGASVVSLGASAAGGLISLLTALQAVARADASQAPRLLSAAAAEALTIGLLGVGAGAIPLGACWAIFGVALSRLSFQTTRRSEEACAEPDRELTASRA